MTAAQVVYVCRLQIRDTFRQAVANRVVWVLLGGCATIILFCLGVRIEEGESLRVPDDIGLDQPHGRVSLVFGAWRLPLFRDGLAMVHYLLLILGEGVFGVIGILLALVLTAGFVPEFLHAGNATVLLSKPTPRWVLLLGRYLGVLALLGCYAGVYVVGTWAALGLGTGFWVNSYLWGLPLFLLQLAAIYSFSAFLGACTGSNLVCVIGSVLFWLTCWGMNYGHHMLAIVEPDVPRQSVVLRGMSEAGYWILPKPVDLGMILRSAVDAGQTDPQLQKFVQLGGFHPELSVLSSLVFIVVMIVLAAQQLASREY
jgi:ABC-type transport system involved in multi-copper enzyme maturation permease subunit